MIKRFTAILAALLLVLATASAMGESSYIDLEARDVVVNRNSETLGCRFAKSDYYCLIKPDGTKLTDELYRSISSISDYPFFKVEVDSEDGVHREGIIDDQGNVVVPAEYADVSLVSDRWAYGVKLTPSSADDKDYTYSNWSTGEKSFFRIDNVDFYYRGQLAGTLERTNFNGNVTAYGDYITVTSQDRTRKFYNSGLIESPYQAEYSGEYTTNYKDRVTHYTHNGTGQEAFVASCTLTADEVDKSIAYENESFRNLQGEELFKAQQNYDTVRDFNGDYAVVRKDSKSGVINKEGQEIIPLEYDEIDDYYGTLSKYGIVEAKKDGKFGYLDANGNVTSEFKYSDDIVRSYGPISKINDLDGSVIVLSGMIGELPEHYKDVDTSINSRAFVAENEKGEHSLIDMSGEVLIPYTDANSITYNKDATVAVHRLDSGVYRIYTFSHDDAITAPAQQGDKEGDVEEQPATDGTWTCSNGHTGLTSKFCPECGEAKPADDIVCPTCGKQFPADEAPNFCPDDGTKLK